MTALPARYADLLEKAERRHVPISALVELTHACNLRCEHCYLDLVSDRAIGALTTDEWKRVLGELADAGCLFLTLSGGEALLRRDFFEIARHARKLEFAIRVYSHGTLVTDDVADAIAELSPMAVEISLHGATAATHDGIVRRAGSFAKTTAGVRALVSRGVSVLLKCVVMKKNAAELGALRALAAELGARIHFDPEVTPKNDGSRGPVALAAQGEELERAMREVHAGASSCAHASQTGVDARLADGPCAAGRRTCHVDPKGDLFACTQWPHPVGNLRRKSFRELWESAPLFERLRATKLGDLACAGCGALAACSPCLALSLLEHGDLDGPSQTRCTGAAARAKALGVAGEPLGRATPPRGEASPATAPAALVRLRRK
jgi:radical SAM protein with 4Fe4S-binding SPASM domain